MIEDINLQQALFASLTLAEEITTTTQVPFFITSAANYKDDGQGHQEESKHNQNNLRFVQYQQNEEERKGKPNLVCCCCCVSHLSLILCPAGRGPTIRLQYRRKVSYLPLTPSLISPRTYFLKS